MIKVNKNHDCKSFWHNEDLYDTERTKSYVIKIFGLTIWNRTEDFKAEYTSEGKSKKVGFHE